MFQKNISEQTAENETRRHIETAPPVLFPDQAKDRNCNPEPASVTEKGDLRHDPVHPLCP
jgi:hypothetical protein